MELRPLKRRVPPITPPNDPDVPTSEQPELPNVSRTIHLTPAQAANWLNVTGRALEDWRGNGVGPTYVELTSKTIRYRIEDLEAFVAEKLRTSTAPAYRSLTERPKNTDAGSNNESRPVR